MYPMLCISSQEDPQLIADRVGHAWSEFGGGFFRHKKIQAFDTVCPLLFFFVYNYLNQDMLIVELLTIILEEARDIMQLNPNYSHSEWDVHVAVPQVAFCRQVPKLPGQDSHQFSKLPNAVNESRRIFSVECNKELEPYLLALKEVAKSEGLFEKYWGKWAHVTTPVDWSSPRGDIKRLVSISQQSANYNYTMTTT